MGVYDTVIVRCPNCDEEHDFQSKSGDCCLAVYTLDECPDDVFEDINRHSPYMCDCGISFEVDMVTKRPTLIISNG